VSTQKSQFIQRAGLTHLTGAPPPLSGGGNAVEVYRPRARPSVTASGEYRVNNSALSALHARRVHEVRATQPRTVSVMNIVSIALIVFSVAVALVAVTLV